MSATKQNKRMEYSEQDLISALRAVADDGVMPTRDRFDEEVVDGPASSTIYARFGGWEDAAKTAGLEPQISVSRGVSDEKMLELIEQVSEDGTAPTMEEYNDTIEDGPTAQAISRRFGSWLDAVEQSDLQPNISGRTKYTDEDLKDKLREAGHDGIGPTKAEFAVYHDGQPAGTTVQERFGSWNEAVREAGLIPQYNPTEEEMVEQLRIISDGETAVKGEDFAEHPHTVSKSTIYDRFGNYTNFVEQAGLDVQYRRGSSTDTSKSEIVADLQELSEDGLAPKVETLNNDPDTVTKSIIQSHFDSYNDAVEAAGLRPHRVSNVNDEDVIEYIRMLADGEKAPTAQEFQTHPETPSFGVAVDHFGSWNEAVKAAGLETNSRGSESATKGEIIDHLQRLANGDEAPTQADVTADEDAPAVVTIKKVFDGWREALDAAGLTPRPLGGGIEITEVEMVEHLQRLGTPPSNPPTQREVIEDKDAPHTSTIKNRLGWGEALERAGYDCGNRGRGKSITEGEMIHHLKRLADGGDAPTQTAVDNDPEAPHSATIKRRIGWDEAVERAELEQ